MLGGRNNLDLRVLFAYPFVRMVFFVAVVTGSLLFLIPAMTKAALDTPQILSYQGRLTDAQKVTVPDGVRNMKFAIYDASVAGTCVWSAGDDAGDGVDTVFSAGVDCPANVPSTTIPVTVTDGLFTVMLGDTTTAQNAFPDALFNTTSPRYLEITIDGETLTPRRRIVSSATALQAGNASLLDNFNTSQTGGLSAYVPVTENDGDLVLSANFTVDTNTLFVDAGNNRVGIGTAAPTDPLFVRLDQNAGTYIGVQNATNDTAAVSGYYMMNGGGAIGAFDAYAPAHTAVTGGGTPLAGMLSLATEAAYNGIIIRTLGSDPVLFGTLDTERMRVDSGGNVGIGDTSPAALFTVGSGDLFQVNSSGRVFAPNGSSGAGNLAYSFVNDTDTGLYRSATNEMRFQTAGSDRVTIDANGNVGIGIATPLVALHVNDTFSGSGVSSTTLILRNDTNDEPQYNQMVFQGVGGFEMAGIRAQHEVGIGDTSLRFLTHTGSPGALNEQMTIQADGKVGIGDTTPAALLTVGSGDLFQVNSSGNLTSPNDVTWTLGGGVDALNFDSNTLSIDAANNRVGIGRADPQVLLTVGPSNGVSGVDSSKLLYVAENTSSTRGMRFENSLVTLDIVASTDGNGYMGTFNNASYSWISNNIERVTITGAGNMGVGDTSPAALLTVGSGDLFQVNSSGNLTSPNDVTWTLGGGVDALNFDSNTLSIDAANNRLGIGTASPAASFHMLYNANDASTAEFRVQNNNTGSLVQSRQRFLAGGNADTAGASSAGVVLTNRTTDHFSSVPGLWISTEQNTADSYVPGLGFAQHTTVRLYIPPSTSGSYGNLGIGTTTPSNFVHLQSTASPQLRNAYDGSNYTTMGVSSTGVTTFDANGSGASFTFSDAVTASGNLTVNGNTTLGDASGDTVTSNAAAWTFPNDTVFNGADIDFVLTGGTDAFTIDGTTFNVDEDNDRVGIGTATPSAKLQVTSTSAATVAQIIRGAASQSANLTSWQNSSGSTLAFVDSTGNVTTGADFLAASAASLGTGYTVSSLSDTSIPFRIMEIVIPSDNNPVIAWVDGSGNVKTAKCTASDCSTTSATVTLDTGAQAESISMALAPDGSPFIVYKKTGNVRVAHCTSVSCSAANLATVADTANDLGSRTSVALLSASSAMAIAFTDQTANDTKYLRCDNPTAATPCTSVTSTVVVGGDSFSSDAVDGYTSFMRMVIVGDGNPLVFTSAARYASSAATVANKCASTDCSSVSSTTLTGTSTNAGIMDAAVGPDGFAAVVQNGISAGGPIFTRCTNLACSTFTNVSLGYEPGSFFVFYAASIAIPSSNNPVLLLTQDGNGNPSKRYYFICSNSSCSSGSLTDLGINEGEDDVTSSSAVEINASGDAVGVLGRATSGTSRAIKIFLSSVLATGTDVGASATRLANAYFSGDIKTGSLTIDGVGAGQGGLSAIGSVTIGDSAGTDRLVVNLGDNLASAVDIQQGTDDYLNITTTNGTEAIAFGNTTTNPKFTFFGTGYVGIGDDSPEARFDIDTTQTTGTISGLSFGAATNQGAGAIVGSLVNVNTNLTTPAAAQDVTGVEVRTPVVNITSGVGAYRGFSLLTAGSVTSSGTAVAQWRGAEITMPAVSATGGGSIASVGVLVNTGSNSSPNANQTGVFISPTSVTGGTLTGMQINGITGSGSATETALNIGSGWDSILTINSDVMIDGGRNILGEVTTLDGSTTANGGGTDATTLILTSATGFDVGNYVFVNSTYAKITNIAVNTLTISPALTWTNGQTVTEVMVPEVGGDNLTSTLANRYGRGYFIDGIVTGNGTTRYTDRLIDSTTALGINTMNNQAVNFGTGAVGFSGDVNMTNNDDQTITFSTSSGANSPMIQMFSGGSSNDDRMVIAHSATFNTWGLQYRDTTDDFAFLAGGVETMLVTLAAGTPLQFEGATDDGIYNTFSFVDPTATSKTTTFQNLTGVVALQSASTLTGNGVLFAGSTGLLTQDNTNFVWDDATNRLGIGTNAPSEALEVYDGNLRISNDASPAQLVLWGDRANSGDAGTVDARLSFHLDNTDQGGWNIDALNWLGYNQMNFDKIVSGVATTLLTLGSSAGDSSNVGIGTQTPGARLSIEDTDTSSNVREVMRLTRTDSDGAGAIGLGAALDYYLEDAASALNQAARLEVDWTDATNGSEDSSFALRTMVNGTLTEVFTVTGSAISGPSLTGTFDFGGSTATGSSIQGQWDSANQTAIDTSIDLLSTGDFTVDDSGTPFATFADNGSVTFRKTGNTVTLTVDGTDISNNNAGGGEHALIVSTTDVATSGDDLFLMISDSDGTPDTEFRFESDGNAFADGAFSGGGADFAEYYHMPSADGVSGHLVRTIGSDQVAKSSGAYDGQLLGVISTNPGFVGGYSDTETRPIAEMKIVALVGRVPTLVSSENGPIAVGDAITSSSVAGVGMKATRPGMTVGIALESFSGPGQGTILLYVHPQYFVGATLAHNGMVTTMEDSLLFGASGTASAGVQGHASRMITLAGSGWDGSAAQMTQFGLSTVVTNASQSRLSVSNTAGSEVFSINQSGDVQITGRLYPSDKGVAQQNKYIYYDSDMAPMDYMRTNAAGWATGSYDFAELFPSTDTTLAAGELVAMDTLRSEHVVRATAANAHVLMGIISTRPGFLAGEWEKGSTKYAVALAGRVPTKVSVEQGAIRIGDALTVSPTRPGVAVKAVQGGMIVGYALADTNVDATIVVFVQSAYLAPVNSASEQTAQTLQGLNVYGDLQLNSFAITGVSRIVGAGNLWEITSDGTLVQRMQTPQGVKSVYASGSPQATVMLFGHGRLVNGEATIALEQVDPGFTAIINTEAPVFVTVTPTNSETNGLYVKAKTAQGFLVADRIGALMTTEFDWTFVAYRKGFGPTAQSTTTPPIAETPAIVEPVVEPVEVVDTAPEVVTDPVSEVVDSQPVAEAQAPVDAPVVEEVADTPVAEVLGTEPAQSTISNESAPIIQEQPVLVSEPTPVLVE